jgi:transcription antitermination factor NusG
VVFGAKFSVGERVRIKDGAFQGFEGVVQSTTGGVITVAVEIAGKLTPTEFRSGSLEKLSGR